MSAPARFPLLTEAEAAQVIGLSERTLRSLRKEGRITYVRKSPGRIAYRADDLAEYIEASVRRETPPCPSTSPPKAASGNMKHGPGAVVGITELRRRRRNERAS